jgi:UDP-glucose 4-epimerase
MTDPLAGHSILLTGATGYLGSISYYILKQGGTLVKGTTHSSPINKQENYLAVDLMKPESFTVLNENGPFDTIVHCAAILPGKKRDIELLISNEKMTYNLMDWAVHNNISHFIFMSSCSVYGYSSGEKTELSMPVPENIYAISKLACEQIIHSFAKPKDMKTCFLRISAPYGPNQKNQTVIKTFLHQAARGESITLMGSGKRSQDFIYETDVGRAVELAVTRYGEGTFNITGGMGISMYDLAEKVLSLFQRVKEGSLQFTGDDAQEDFRGIYPIKSARDYLGYNPCVNIDDGLYKTAKGWGLL